MAISKAFSRVGRSAAWFSWALALPGYGQGGKEFFEWAKLYSPTSVFIITEAEKSQAGFHKQFVRTEAIPIPAVPVHESCHLFNSRFGGNGSGQYGYFVGNNQARKVAINFQPFNSKLIAADIPADLRTFITDVYIISGVGGNQPASMSNGAWGIMDEYAAYGSGLRSDIEFAACIKANFDAPKNWGTLALDAQPSVEASQQFRYFVLRYALYAKKNYPDIYQKILASQETREAYTAILQFHAQNIKEWAAVLGAQKMDTAKGNGFDVYRKFLAELEKPEYTEMEKLLLVTPSGIVSRFPDSRQGLARFHRADVSVGIFDFRGRTLRTLVLNALDDAPFRQLGRDVQRRYGRENPIIRLSLGRDALTLTAGALAGLSPNGP